MHHGQVQSMWPSEKLASECSLGWVGRERLQAQRRGKGTKRSLRGNHQFQSRVKFQTRQAEISLTNSELCFFFLRKILKNPAGSEAMNDFGIKCVYIDLSMSYI